LAIERAMDRYGAAQRVVLDRARRVAAILLAVDADLLSGPRVG